jgi:hypothetical protein
MSGTRIASWMIVRIIKIQIKEVKIMPQENFDKQQEGNPGSQREGDGNPQGSAQEKPLRDPSSQQQGGQEGQYHQGTGDPGQQGQQQGQTAGTAGQQGQAARQAPDKDDNDRNS